MLIGFPQGWLVHWEGWPGPADGFWIVIERPAGRVRYFTSTPHQAITSHYEMVRGQGHPDDRWMPSPPERPLTRPGPSRRLGPGRPRRR